MTHGLNTHREIVNQLLTLLRVFQLNLSTMTKTLHLCTMSRLRSIWPWRAPPEFQVASGTCLQSWSVVFTMPMKAHSDCPKDPNLDHSHGNMAFPDITTYTQATTDTVDSPASTATAANHVVSPRNVTLGQTSLVSDNGSKQALAAGKVSEVDWLKDVVQERPGWQAFINGMNRNQQNPDVARSWRFAVNFAKEYNKTVSKGAVGNFYFMPQRNSADNMDRAGWTNRC
jgi:hypothetical protein